MWWKLVVAPRCSRLSSIAMSWAALCACQSTHDVSPDNHDRVSTAVRDFGSCLSHDLVVVVVVIVVGVVIGVVICCCGGVVVVVVVAKPETTHHFRSDVRTSRAFYNLTPTHTCSTE